MCMYWVQLCYNLVSEVYFWVDVWFDGKLWFIYFVSEYDLQEFIVVDFVVQDCCEWLVVQESLDVDILEDVVFYNCEYVVFQSWFVKCELMCGDLYYFFFCELNCNLFWGNMLYFDFFDYGEVFRIDCGKCEFGEFEFVYGKGVVVCVMLYFLLCYFGVICIYSEWYLYILFGWYCVDLFGEWEYYCNVVIFGCQGNCNLLIDYLEWVEQIVFGEGLGCQEGFGYFYIQKIKKCLGFFLDVFFLFFNVVDLGFNFKQVVYQSVQGYCCCVLEGYLQCVFLEVGVVCVGSQSVEY